MTITGEEDIIGLKKAGAAVADALAAMQRAVRPGITPLELDEIGGRVLDRHGARSAPQLAYDFPSVTCISVGDAVAHGIADATPLKSGQLLNIDVSAELDGYWADMGASMTVGEPSPEQRRLLEVTRQAQQRAMEIVKAGRPLNLIGRTVEGAARRAGYRVAPELNGHGVGRGIHEEPTVPNFYMPHDRSALREGLVITIEPFLTPGSGEIYTDSDGWTLRTADKSPMAQFEHTLIVTRGEPIVVTALQG